MKQLVVFASSVLLVFCLERRNPTKKTSDHRGTVEVLRLPGALKAEYIPSLFFYFPDRYNPSVLEIVSYDQSFELIREPGFSPFSRTID